MTTLLSEVFAETEVIFVDEADPRNFQVTGDSFLQMRSLCFGCVFCVYGVYTCVFIKEGVVVVVDSGIILRWREKYVSF